MLDRFKLDNKVALVTGAGRGLGQGMAIALAEAGADVAGLGSGSLDETADRVKTLGRRFLPLKVNLLEANADDLNKVVGRVVADLGRLDILVNNAGIIRRAPVLEFSEQDWDDVIQVNLKAVFLLSQAAGRVMVEYGQGKIINIASMLSFQGGIRVASYTASKGGVAGITRLMANELAPKGININAIAPGYMATDITETLRADPERGPAILDRIPAGRWGNPDDLKGAVIFLASPASDYVNGAIVPVDGGWLTR
ncbi:MAG: 2-dehydro-3-deoxy-D-gluconate 5-dehydrogenase KduD [Anaerolineales bacterium]|uniref:2-dehydro-3-deoxy-D-gluconate 5-dehydrogenase KduD n=1 Tax=Candidatus Desulfolinea nitratireducens TaxID=2841698 RepID=A0A8J6TJP6_9CHLR|nr:2-dehydro-3-deoxy-D-gluconate 5-dehydrogenase KduD [Candidatus Desulfolinea nitratireducens]